MNTSTVISQPPSNEVYHVKKTKKKKQGDGLGLEMISHCNVMVYWNDEVEDGEVGLQLCIL
jgi:hypothetical protein